MALISSLIVAAVAVAGLGSNADGHSHSRFNPLGISETQNLQSSNHGAH